MRGASKTSNYKKDELLEIEEGEVTETADAENAPIKEEKQQQIGSSILISPDADIDRSSSVRSPAPSEYSQQSKLV